MSAEQQQQASAREGSVLIVEVFPGAVEAGSEMTLTGTVSGAAGHDLRGQPLVIMDHQGGEAARVAFAEFDGENSKTSSFNLTAPHMPGDYTWTAVMPGDTPDAPVKAKVPVSFSVNPHSTSVVIWDVPAAIELGKAFNVKLGIKCPAACDLAGATYAVHDHHGARVASGTVRDEPWHGTAGLHYAEVALTAPDEEGLHRWVVTASAPEGGAIPHQPGSAKLRVRVTPAGEFRVAIHVFDAEKKTPLEAARIHMHPYRAVTDADGRVEFQVPRGDYKIVASGRDYVSATATVEVTKDISTSVGLVFEPPDDEKLWMWS